MLNNCTSLCGLKYFLNVLLLVQLHEMKSRERAVSVVSLMFCSHHRSLNTLYCFVLFICIPRWFIVTSQRYFPPLIFVCFSTERSGHWEVLLAASSEQWPRLGRILHVFPVALSFSTLVIKAADSAALISGALFLRTHSTLPHILMP